MSRPIRTRGAYIVAAALALAALGAATAAGMVAHTAVGTARVGVAEREYRITPTQRSLAAGLTTFVVHNAGKIAHEFEIRGPGIAGKRIAGRIPPGASRSLIVRLRAGRYTLFCPLHLALGMKTTIRVGPGSGTTMTTGGTTTSGSSWG